jgi:hypothetical protein
LIKVDDSTVEIEIFKAENVLIVVANAFQSFKRIEVDLLLRVVIEVGVVGVWVLPLLLEEVPCNRILLDLDPLDVWDELDVKDRVLPLEPRELV